MADDDVIAVDDEVRFKTCYLLLVTSYLLLRDFNGC